MRVSRGSIGILKPDRRQIDFTAWGGSLGFERIVFSIAAMRLSRLSKQRSDAALMLDRSARNCLQISL